MSNIVERTPALIRYADGRERCTLSSAGRKEYAARRHRMWLRDEGICVLCSLPVSLEECTFEHINGRGMDSGKRDDRESENAVSHYFGNSHRGSISLVKYLQLPLEKRIANCMGER